MREQAITDPVAAVAPVVEWLARERRPRKQQSVLQACGNREIATLLRDV